ncbi:hypothetical protein H6F74_06985 [Trichocoleus sp. FACHB-90]|uniref:hypothetical protein n=1 Tax=Cyanophyceae TaxID=3028117 RepID=UPI0016897D64|nr:hypothetical protein [Trichocoleus sp. FACHB-90]MBD1925997.1 hypothetical protein [Trichocoleus sp. FACHB-90]
MNFLRRTIVILGTATLLAGLPLVIYAQPLQTPINQMSAEYCYKQGMEKAGLGDYQGAIEDLQKAADLFQQQGKEEDYQQALQAINYYQEVIQVMKGLQW